MVWTAPQAVAQVGLLREQVRGVELLRVALPEQVRGVEPLQAGLLEQVRVELLRVALLWVRVQGMEQQESERVKSLGVVGWVQLQKQGVVAVGLRVEYALALSVLVPRVLLLVLRALVLLGDDD